MLIYRKQEKESLLQKHDKFTGWHVQKVYTILVSRQISKRGLLRPPAGVPNDIPTPSRKSSIISEQVDISILIILHELKCPIKEIIKATTWGPRHSNLPQLVALREFNDAVKRHNAIMHKQTTIGFA